MRRELTSGLVAVLLGVLSQAATGQQGSAQPPVQGMASTVGLYVYPAKAQSASQQLTDESQCYSNAKAQTGVDPNATAPAKKGQTDKSSSKGGAAKGALGGAALSGATGGDAAAGARRGAIIGGIRSKRKEKKDTEQADKQADAAKTQEQQQQGDFKRAMSACLSARSYSVQ